jgi:hypothetical protein
LQKSKQIKKPKLLRMWYDYLKDKSSGAIGSFMGQALLQHIQQLPTRPKASLVCKDFLGGQPA